MADFKQITVGGVSHPVKDEVARQGLAEKQDKLTFDDTPTANSNNPVKSGGVFQAIQSIDVSGQISGKADKSEMSVVAGTGADADKTTITLKSGTSATVLTQHQDVSGKQDTIQDLPTIRSGAAAGATAYQKPGTGIPSTDLASAVQTSLERADEAAVRPYNTQSPDGMGYLVLDKDATFASQVTAANTIYEIRYDYDLNGHTITLPAGCVLEFDGGSIKNGVLNGTLLTSDGFVDLRSIGVVYNNSAFATDNSRALNILSGVTNEVKLKVSGEVWIGGGSSVQGVNAKFINLDGNGNTIHIDGFSGFIVSDGVEIRNCKVVTETWETSKGFFNQFVKVQNITRPIDVLFDGNYFKGSMRILSAGEIASGVTENNEFISTNYDVCLNNLIISNNIFEEICCGTMNNTLFYCGDSNIINVNIYNNIIHNFFATFAGFGITNDSIYGEYINDFYKHIGRSFNITNNNVSNDIDFKPWTKINQPTAYFCFVLVESGICNYSVNSVVNVIGNDANNAVYDAYLSVDVLTYENNTIKNVLNIAGAYNEILKSKGGAGQELRKYVGNRFTLEDLSEVFDVDVTSLPYILVNTNSVMQDYVIENNFIDFCTITLNVNNLLSAVKLYVRDNVIKINNAITSAIRPALFSIDTACEYAIIKNNTISVSSSSAYLPYLFGGRSGSTAKVSVSENNLTNMSLYSCASDNISISGKCSRNTYSVDGSTLSSTSANFCLQNYYNTSIIFSENEVTVSNVTGNDSLLCLSPIPFDIKVKRSLTTGMIPIYRINANMRAVVKIEDANGLLVGLYEFLINMADSSTAELTAFDYNGNYVSGTSSRTNLFNFAGGGNYLQINNRSFILNSTPAEFTLKFEIFSDAKLSMFPQKGTTAQRPTSALDASNVGVTYFDTTLGKIIYWAGTAWVDATGVPAESSLKVLSISQADYAALATKDNNTLYIVTP
jgi:hypothetical protein